MLGRANSYENLLMFEPQEHSRSETMVKFFFFKEETKIVEMRKKRTGGKRRMQERKTNWMKISENYA